MDASASTDREGPIAAYSWDFGDGSGTATGVTAVHLYRSAGNFAVTLTVTDRKGATGTASRMITVAPNTPPTASITVTPSSGRAPLTVTFNASASSDPDGTIVRYEWWFGDGVGFDGTDAERQHTYLFSGRFVVTLKVSDDRDGVGTASALVIVTSDTAAKWYSIIEIPPSSQACVTPTGINNLGMVAGYYYYPADGTDPPVHAFLFDGRSSLDLGTLGGKKAYAWDLNDYGDVVGDSQIAGGGYRAFLYTKGTMRDLGALDGWVSGATGINNAGQIVGWWNGDHQFAFLYENGQMRSLGSPGSDSSASAISENGTVAGTWRETTDVMSALFIYRDGVMNDSRGTRIDGVGGINDAGDVVGTWHTACGLFNGFLYRGGVWQPLVSCDYSPATGINNEGVVVGYFDRGAYQGAGAYVWDKTKGLQDLNTLIDPALGSTLHLAKGINDVGQIVAVEQRDAGQCDRALLLTPAR
jgi:probable HAF family extracellular repeat protein